MKNLFAAILVSLTVSTSSVSFAATTKTLDKGQNEQAAPAAVTFAQVVKSKLDVVVENTANAKIIIRLTDAGGRSIASKTLSGKESDTRVRFDLANLTDGVYQVKVWNGKNTQLQKFEVKTSEVTVASYQNLAII